MGAKALVQDRKFLLQRIKRTGSPTDAPLQVVYTGSLRHKPTGYRVVKEV